MKIIELINNTIVLERKPTIMFHKSGANSCKYLCKFNIYDRMERFLFSVTLSEADIIKFLEAAYNHIEFNRSESKIVFNSGSLSKYLELYGFNLIEDNKLGIFTYYPDLNTVNSNRILVEIKGKDSEYNLEDFLTDIHSEFISDIPDLTYLNPDFLN